MRSSHRPMDETTLSSLALALQHSPDNRALRFVLVRAYFERGELPRALDALGDADRASDLGADDRVLAARVLIASSEHERALGLTAGGTGELGMLRARALLALGRKQEAAETYRNTLAANPALEDVDLKALIE